MEKPNITKGEWFIEEKSQTPDWGLNCSVRSKTSQNVSEGITPVVFHKHDAKAISAAPEMIDALIEAYHLVQSLKKTPEWNVNVHPADEENIINALKKAGCSD